MLVGDVLFWAGIALLALGLVAARRRSSSEGAAPRGIGRPHPALLWLPGVGLTLAGLFMAGAF